MEPIGKTDVRSPDIFASWEYIPIPTGPTINARTLFLATFATKFARVENESFDMDLIKSLIVMPGSILEN